jgi:hypothetical protein
VALYHDYNLRASVLRGAAMAAMNDADMVSLEASYDFMEKSNFSAMMFTCTKASAAFSFSLPVRSRSAMAQPRIHHGVAHSNGRITQEIGLDDGVTVLTQLGLIKVA